MTSDTEVRSVTARLFAGTWRPLVSVITTFYYVAISFFISSSVVSRAFSALCMYSTFGHHPHPLGYTFVPNFVSFVPSIAELARGEKSRTQSINQSITQLI